jgi:seryl-tRNA synthetase
MLDVNLFRNDLEGTARRLGRKKVERATIDELAGQLGERRRLTAEVDRVRAEINSLSKSIGQLMAKGQREEAEQRKAEVARAKERLPELERELGEFEQRIEYILLRLPNLPADDAPDGEGEADNKVRRVHFRVPEGSREVIEDADKVREYFRGRAAAPGGFALRPHWELGAELGILDSERAAKVSGSMFALLRGEGARLLRALVRLALDLNGERYEEILPPHLVRTETFTATGQLPKFETEAYKTRDDDAWLIPTGEVPLMGLHMGEILEEAELPRRYMAYTACFRREAGAAGKDTRGMQRLHEFHKVELVKLCTPEQVGAEFEGLVADACRPLELLGLPYRVLDLCAADLTFGSARTFDLEVYAPGVDRWLEVSSCGIYTDFQTRRGNIRYRPADGGKPVFCYAMNGSGLATPRVWAAILEHYQQADGSVRVPEALGDYMKVKEIRRR